MAQIHPHSLFQEIRILYSPLFETAMRNNRKQATFICAQNTLPPATCVTCGELLSPSDLHFLPYRGLVGSQRDDAVKGPYTQPGVCVL